ncbi:gamma-tubulin complex component 5-like [Lineus longissimus]|uniref:gamma-tubulin complex component 5-like n=1 Tax=Lineus longissimus TaxID=88925 RepID=UPI002B4D1623
MAHERGNFENSVKNLIKLVTCFSDKDENFPICLNFALSNFKYHRFLDVDSHKVTRAIDGIIEKFQVHSQQPKANSFKKLVDEFLEGPLPNENPKSDTHYALISLLLSLSEAPTKKKYQPLAEKDQDVEEDAFDWAGYLLEGENVRQIYPESDSEYSDEEEEEVPRDSTLREADSGIAVNNELISRVVPPGVDVTIALDDFLEDDDGRSWLAQNVVVQYWKSIQRCSTPNFHRSCRLGDEWADHVSEIHPFSGSADRRKMTEAQVCRELLWMILGSSNLYIFKFDGSEFHVRENIEVSHLTPETLARLLQMFGRYGSLIQKLNRFLEDALFTSPSQSLCATYIAFAGSLYQYFQGMNKEVVKLEQVCVRQEETVTLSQLLQKLKPRFQHLDVLDQVFEEGILAALDIESHAQKASHLLNVLYDALISVDTYGEDRSDAVSLLLPIWIETSKPYLDIISDWVMVGNLTDYQKEFSIQRNHKIKSDEETFWDTAFTLHCTLVPTTTKDDSSQAMPPSGDAENKKSEKLQRGTLGRAVVPSFLKPVMNEIILTGKSMELLQDLGKLVDVSGSSKGQTSLYDKFLSELKTLLGTKSDSSLNCDSSTDDSQAAPLFKGTLKHHMTTKTGHNTLLEINFENIYNSSGFRAELFNTKNEEILKDLENLKCSSLVPIQLILKQCLYPHITSRYEYISSQLLQILWNDYQLADYLAAMRHFFLMEAGDTMYDFSREIFEKLRLHEPWNDTTFLNWALHGALQVHFPREIDRLLVHIEEVPITPRTSYPIYALNSLRLYYKVPWPVSLIIDSRCQRVYNQIFTFVMQIKRAKYSLEQLSFADLEKVETYEQKKDVDETFFSIYQTEEVYKSSLVHRMHIFKLRLLHFVNSLENYIMTRILHSTGLEFQREIREAKDLDQVLQAHNSYVNKIFEMCLLPKRVQHLKDAIMKVLSLSLTFQAKWDAGVVSLTLKELSDMEKNFSKCIHFLASFLVNVSKRGTFPHLDSLASAVIESSEHC